MTDVNVQGGGKRGVGTGGGQAAGGGSEGLRRFHGGGGSRRVWGEGPAGVKAICWLVTMRSARPRDCSSLGTDGLRGIMQK